MTRLKLYPTQLSGLTVIEHRRVEDSRGWLDPLFCERELGGVLSSGGTIKQVNVTLTHTKHTVRGLHFQHPPWAEMKIVTCLRGQVWDVAVDLRQGSPTFLQYHPIILTSGDKRSFLIPEGFAHGFQTLTPDCEMLYFHTAEYSPQAEGGINALDPRLAIHWPKPLANRSPRDEQQPMLPSNFRGLHL